jgi:hypothetical protein
MDNAKFDSEIYPKLLGCRELLKKCCSSVGGEKAAIVLIESQGLFEEALYGFQRILSKIPKGKGITSFSNHGGSIDVASAIACLCRGRFVISMCSIYDQSAAFISLAADENNWFCTTRR